MQKELTISQWREISAAQKSYILVLLGRKSFIPGLSKDDLCFLLYKLNPNGNYFNKSFKELFDIVKKSDFSRFFKKQFKSIKQAGLKNCAKFNEKI